MALLYPYFYVITVLFNPLSYQRRYDLFKKFEQHIHSFGVQLITVELAFNNQTFQVTNSNNPNHVQLSTNHYLWYKENLINIALKRLPNDCKYVAWIDADLEFTNRNFIEDTINALEIYNVVQLFEYANFLGPESQILRIDTGFGWSYATGQKYYSKSYKPFKLIPLKEEAEEKEKDVVEENEKAVCKKNSDECLVDTTRNVDPPFVTYDLYSNPSSPVPSSPRPPKSPCCIIVSKETQMKKSQKSNGANNIGKQVNKQTPWAVYWHPGYCWAAKRSTLLNINGLFDRAILGASDRMMAFCFIDKLEDGLTANMSESYKATIFKWCALVNKHIEKKVGYINGTINHFWHGSRTDRQYVNRERILQSAPIPYDPHKHLYYDENHLLHLNAIIKDYYSDSIREYFSNRREDNIKTIGHLI